MHPLRSATVVSSLLVLAGCGAGRDYERPPVAEQAAWTGSAAPVGSTATVPLAQWWRSFGDERLDRLVAAALAQNLDLKRALARIDETRASRRSVRWLLAPDVDVAGSVERRKYSANVPGPVDGGIAETYEAGFDLNWEIDLSGGLRRGIEAQSADLAARQAGYHEVAVLIAAETARAYIDLLAAQEQLAVAQADLADLVRVRAVIGARVDAGAAPTSALAQADATRLLAAAALPEYELRRTNALTRLATLLSVPPAEVLGAGAGSPFAELPSVVRLPEAASMFPAGLPSDLVRRRPDLRRAEREIAAAVARVGVAERDLYPRFSLTGSFGLESDAPGDFFESGSRFWSIGPAVRWPLLQIGRVRALIAAADARADQAALAWQQAVLAAYGEVEDALAGVARGQERARAVGEALAAQERALAAVRVRYERGAEDLLALLVESRNASVVRQQAVEARRTSALRVVALAKALGGGWDPAAVAAR